MGSTTIGSALGSALVLVSIPWLVLVLVSGLAMIVVSESTSERFLLFEFEFEFESDSGDCAPVYEAGGRF